MPSPTLMLDDSLIKDRHVLTSNLQSFSNALLQEALVLESIGATPPGDDFLLTFTISKKGALNLIASLQQLINQINNQESN